MGTLALREFRDAEMALIKRTVAADCNADEFRLFIHLCRHTGLDPLRGQAFAFVFNKDHKDQSKRKLTLVTAIAGYRTIADRTGAYRPSEDAPEYHLTPAQIERDEEMAIAKRLPDLKDRRAAIREIEEAFRPDPLNPQGIERAVVYAWKYAHGAWHRVAGEAWWNEYVPLKEEWSEEHPGAKAKKTGRAMIDPKKPFWLKGGRLVIAKCAEAQALRRGWPDDYSSVYEESETHREATRLDAVEAARAGEAKEREALARQTGRTFLLDFGPNTPIRAVDIDDLKDKCLAFIDANASQPEMLDAWYTRHRDQFRLFRKSESHKNHAIDIGRRLDEIMTQQTLRLEADQSQTQGRAA
jgi:phage recombination protein Bet